MKNISLFVALLLAFSICQAQFIGPFGVINDPDGYTNVREGSNSKSKVVTKIYDHQPFYMGSGDVDVKFEMPTSGWVGIERTGSLAFMSEEQKAKLSDEERERLADGGRGNIHSSKVYDITSGEKLKGRKIGKNFMAYTDGEVSFLMKAGPFDEKQHTFASKLPI